MIRTIYLNLYKLYYLFINSNYAITIIFNTIKNYYDERSVFPMLRSSLGFHTMTLSLLLFGDEIYQLLDNFIEYNEKTGFLLMFRKNENGVYINYSPQKGNIPYLPSDIIIRYNNRNKGIKWHIYDNRIHSMGYIVDVIINPKTLSNIPDYITAATYCDMKMAIICFNDEMKRISPLLKTFYDYDIKRVDYCINFYLKELAPECSQEQIINLLKRGDIPPSYQEWTEYAKKSHRNKRKPESFYLFNSSVTINCYSKYLQLKNQSKKNQEKGYAPIPPKILESAQDIIRFEVQCKYHKTFTLNQKAEALGNHDLNKFKSLLGHNFYNREVHYYWDKVIGKGDWFTMQEATRIIQSKHFNSQKEKRLIEALQFVSLHRSLATAKSLLKGYELEAFKRTLNDLYSLNINPVTIPKRWNICHIPNLLYQYYTKAQLTEFESTFG